MHNNSSKVDLDDEISPDSLPLNTGQIIIVVLVICLVPMMLLLVGKLVQKHFAPPLSSRHVHPSLKTPKLEMIENPSYLS